MSAKSHVDLCMFIQILEIEEDKIPESIKAALLSRNYGEINQILSNDNDNTNIRFRFVNKETNLHESIHLIQGVIYPYLRLYSVFSFIQMHKLFKMVPEPVLSDEQNDVLSVTIPELSLLDLEFYVADLSKRFLFWRFNKHVLGVSADHSHFRADQILTKLSVVDLLENAASLMQYKITSGKDFPSWVEFQRWSKRNPSYTAVLDFIAKYLGNSDLAIRILLPVIQVAFETNWPVRTFVNLIGAIKINCENGHLDAFIAQPEPCRWIELLDTYMDKIKFEEADMGDFATSKYFRLDRYATSNIRIGGKLGHPITGKFAKLWGDLERVDIAYRYAFTAPNGYKSQISKIDGLFTSPIAVLKFTVQAQNIALVVGDMMNSGISGWIEQSGDAEYLSNVSAALVDFLLLYGVARRFSSSLMDPDFRLCHHCDCRFYRSNYCNTWIFIPVRYQDCTFIERFRYVSDVANHRATPESSLSVGGATQ